MLSFIILSLITSASCGDSVRLTVTLRSQEIRLESTGRTLDFGAPTEVFRSPLLKSDEILVVHGDLSSAVYNLTNGEKVRGLTNSTLQPKNRLPRFRSAFVTPDGKYLVLHSPELLRVVNIETGKPVLRWVAEKHHYFSHPKVSADGNMLSTVMGWDEGVDPDGELWIFDLRNIRLVGKRDVRGGESSGFWSEKGKYLAYSVPEHLNKSIYIVENMHDGSTVELGGLGFDFGTRQGPIVEEMMILEEQDAMLVMERSNTASGQHQFALRRFNLKSSSQSRPHRKIVDYAYFQLVFWKMLSDGRTMISSDLGGTLYWIDTETRELIRTWRPKEKIHYDWRDAFLSPNRSWVVGSSDRSTHELAFAKVDRPLGSEILPTIVDISEWGPFDQFTAQFIGPSLVAVQLTRIKNGTPTIFKFADVGE